MAGAIPEAAALVLWLTAPHGGLAMRASFLPVLALAGLAHAAPAPFPRPAPEQAPVLLHGWLPGQRLVGNPSVIACQADYEAAAKALGIETLPRVNFKTHFLFIN